MAERGVEHGVDRRETRVTVTRGPASPVDDLLGPFGDTLAWEPEPLPDIADVLGLWDRFEPFWLADRSDEPVDELRTLALHDQWNHSVRLNPGRGRSAARSGFPFMRVDESFARVAVHDASCQAPCSSARSTRVTAFDSRFQLSNSASAVARPLRVSV